MMRTRGLAYFVTAIVLLALLSGCAYLQQERGERTTSRDKTKKGAAIGAAGGAVLGAVLGEGELDEILAGAAIGAGIGAGVGAYMDRQEEKLARIPGTTVERVDEDMLLVHFESDVLFDIDSAVLTGASRSAIDQAAAVFVEYPKTAIIAQGHTDSTGTDAHNQQLSERRADSVMSYLVAQGVGSDRITAEGYGERYPVATNDTVEGRTRNRRVDLLLKAKAR
jgi:outer membrane protein OmpA-like peptidoglycan-associated protein